MQLTSQQLLPIPQNDLWSALNDVQVLQACIPGCESLTQVAENEYELLIMVAIGPVKTKFKGKLRLADLNPPVSYTIYFEGQGGIAGHGKGSAQVHIEPQSPTQTLLRYTANASVGGKIAQVGSRLVDMAAQKMAAEFFAAFEQQLPSPLASTQAIEPVQANAHRSWLVKLRSWWRRLIAKSQA